MELLEKEQTRLYGIVGELTAQNDWVKKNWRNWKVFRITSEFVEESLYFSISEQCRWYGISRGKYYHSPRITKDEHSAFKEKIRVKYTLDPSSGSRRITAALNRDGIKVQRGLIRMLMKVMNLKGLTPKKKLNHPKDSAHKLPYLLRDIEIMRPNQV